MFMFLLGTRLKKWWRGRKQKQAQGTVWTNKNQRSKLSRAGEPAFDRERRLTRERRTRRFTFVLLVALFGLAVFMIPALVRDLMVPEGVDAGNLFLRCLILAFTIYIFILAYLKVARRKHEDNQLVDESVKEEKET